MNRLLVDLTDALLVDSVSAAISDTLGEDFAVTNLRYPHTDVIRSFLGYAQSVLLSVILAAVFIATARVFSSFTRLLSERSRETGVMLAFGSSYRQLLEAILVEMLVLAAVGGAAGCIIGVTLSYFVQSTLVAQARLTMVGPATNYFQVVVGIDVPSMLLAAVGGLVLTVLGGLWPAVRAVRAPVVHSLNPRRPQSGEGAARHTSLGLLVRGIVLLVTVALCVAVGVQVLSDTMGLGIVSDDWLRLLSIPAVLLALGSVSPRASRPMSLLRLFVARCAPVVGFMSSRGLRRNVLDGLVVFNLFASVTVLFLTSANIGYAVTNSWTASVTEYSSSVNVVASVYPAAPTSIADQVAGMPGVTGVAATNYVVSTFRHGALTQSGVVMGVDPAAFASVVRVGLMESTEPDAGLQVIDTPGTCVVSEYAARVLHVGVGDTVMAGSSELTVVGVCSSSLPVFVMVLARPAFVLIGPETWASVVGQEFAVSGLLVESSDPQATVNALADLPGVTATLVEAVQTRLLDNAEAIRTVIDTSLIVMFIVTAVSAVLSGWSLAASRRHEIGILSAFGTPAADIARAVAAESAVTMTAGVALGFVAGMVVEVAMLPVVARFGTAAVLLLEPRSLALVAVSLLAAIVASYAAVRHSLRRPAVLLVRDMRRE